MTPSKSKTMACNARPMRSGAGRLLAGTDRHFQPIRGGRIRTFVRFVVRTGGVVGLIEVDRVESRARRWDIEVPARFVGLLPGGEVGERNEELRNLPGAGRHQSTEAHL